MKATDILKEEHRNIERMLDLLERRAEGVAGGDHVDPDFFRSALRFIREYADACHHGKEEDLLFTRMVERGFPKENGPIAIMLYEHQVGRDYVRGLAEAVERCAAGEAESPAIVDNALGYVNLLRNHIYKEDNILFRMADEHLSERDQAMLVEQFDALHATSAVCGKRVELVSLIAELEAGGIT